MKVYELIKDDKERKVNISELYLDILDAKEEMWNKIEFQRKIRNGLLITEVSDVLVLLSEQKEIGGKVQEVITYSIEERKVH